MLPARAPLNRGTFACALSSVLSALPWLSCYPTRHSSLLSELQGLTPGLGRETQSLVSLPILNIELRRGSVPGPP